MLGLRRGRLRQLGRGGDAPSYTPTVDDAGNTIEVCVSATNTWGTSASEYRSDPANAVSLPPAPTNRAQTVGRGA